MIDDSPEPSTARAPVHRLTEVATLFLRLGLTAFGGPAAHVAIMHDEVVKRRKWLSEQDFLDLFGAANLIPGPTSTEMAIYLGYKRVGWMGLVLGGVCFLMPAMCIVLVLAWLYVQYGTTPAANRILYGVLPVVIAIIAQALWSLGHKAVKSWLTALAGSLTVALYLLNWNVLLVLLLGGLLVMLGKNLNRFRHMPILVLAMPLAGVGITFVSIPFSLPLLFLYFLKIGATLYGSGYVLLAFLRADFVVHLGWLTDKQLIDSIAIGQVTPGPLFTTATFIGYLLGGLPGAILGTVGIFLPSFIFVGLSSFFITRLRNSSWAAGFLDGVNAASLGLMLGVTFQLALTALMDPLTILIGLISLVLLFRFHLNSTWLIAGGALAGFLTTILR